MKGVAENFCSDNGTSLWPGTCSGGYNETSFDCCARNQIFRRNRCSKEQRDLTSRRSSRRAMGWLEVEDRPKLRAHVIPLARWSGLIFHTRPSGFSLMLLGGSLRRIYGWTPVNIKLLLPFLQSRGISHWIRARCRTGRTQSLLRLSAREEPCGSDAARSFLLVIAILVKARTAKAAGMPPR